MGFVRNRAAFTPGQDRWRGLPSGSGSSAIPAVGRIGTRPPRRARNRAGRGQTGAAQFD